MKWIEIKVIFDCTSNEIATDLISNIFYDLGLKGVVVEDSDIKPIEEGENSDEIRQADIAVTGYIPENNQSQTRLETIREKLSGLEKEFGIASKIIGHKIDEQDWAESWK
jgi:ribosomal protein L11 methyltransferase